MEIKEEKEVKEEMEEKEEKEEKEEMEGKEEKEEKDKKKRKNKKGKKHKENNENIPNKTILEIKKLNNNKSINSVKSEKENEGIGEKEGKDNMQINNEQDEDTILLIKKTLINFNTEESLFQKGRMNPQNFPEEEKNNTYYVQRYYFFSLFDKGIQMDKESWYSVTPEEISEYISSIIPDAPNSSILDGFCGCGGNVIYFSKYFKKVFANDLFESKINMTKNNAKIYECPDNIQYFNKDYFELNLDNEKIDYVFLSPPWGGPEYKKDKIYSLKKWMNPDVDKIIEKSLKFSKNIIFYLPRNTDLEELGNLLNKYDKESIHSVNNTILFDVKYLNSASKIKAILILYGVKFNLIKVKLVRESLINSVFRKNNSNKANETKVRKQINILKVIGYSKYIANFIYYKEMNEGFSGNIFLEMLEKYFMLNIMDDEEKKEYENLNKIKSINYEDNDDNNNNNLMNIDPNENENGCKNNEKENKIDINEFIDLRNILSEEEFNTAKQAKFFKDNKLIQ